MISQPARYQPTHRFGKQNPSGISVCELLTPRESIAHWRHRRTGAFKWFLYRHGDAYVVVPEVILVMLFLLFKG